MYKIHALLTPLGCLYLHKSCRFICGSFQNPEIGLLWTMWIASEFSICNQMFMACTPPNVKCLISGEKRRQSTKYTVSPKPILVMESHTFWTNLAPFLPRKNNGLHISNRLNSIIEENPNRDFDISTIPHGIRTNGIWKQPERLYDFGLNLNWNLLLWQREAGSEPKVVKQVVVSA